MGEDVLDLGDYQGTFAFEPRVEEFFGRDGLKRELKKPRK